MLLTDNRPQTYHYLFNNGVPGKTGRGSLYLSLNPDPDYVPPGPEVPPVPEPETWALAGMGLAGALLAGRRKQRVTARHDARPMPMQFA
ncbi:hypothetical protein IGB42_04220 [Andreprevotia sp. IGB-42]|uniref:PEP-CTERM sorting domain-containing protein n=1 Tax=Andreprevotia sp. IGB-42 TaxID=2497473 RepID=UPI001356C254|nr:PEP-CTERM sorting domain-containing protein [Andreprevotia sp. IGB-42]KAF0811325.1 hypothetical protein IGB42_04220 [Andreprevotia sp. IGB-42]